MKKTHHLWKTLPLFFIIFSIAGALLFLVALSHHWQVTLKERTDFENSEVSMVLQGKTAIEQKLAGVVSDINYLAKYGEHYGTSHGEALSLFDNEKEQKQSLIRFLQIFSSEKQVFDQIRFLNTEGAELIRINYNNGKPYPVAAHNLQKKTSRYYFQEMKNLKRNELYVSPLDLNVENGRIEQPYKPVLRFGKAVFNAAGEHKGFLLLNFMGNELLEAFHEATKFSQTHIMLLNADSYWLHSPDKSQQWGFMLDNENKFSKQYKPAWLKMINEKKGQFYTRNNLFTCATVNPLKEHSINAPQWKIVSIIPQSHPNLGGVFERYYFPYASILLLLALGAWLLARTLARNHQAELQVAFEQRFRQVLEHVDLLAISLDAKGNIIFCNEALAKLTGWSRDEMMGKNWFSHYLTEEYLLKAKNIINELSSGQQLDAHEDALITTRSGKICKVDWNHTVMKDSAGEVIGLTCIGENVTNIRDQEKQVLTLSRAIEQSPVVVMIVDTKGGIQYVNPRFTEVTGYDLEDVRGKNPSVLQSDSSTDEVDYSVLWGKIKKGQTWHGIFKNKKKNNDIYWASASISCLRDNAGEIVNYIGVQVDITQQRKLERELARRNKEIAKSNTLAIVGRMASMVAHDLRNPLSSIKMGLQILNKPTKEGMEDSAQELKEIALEQVGYMEVILEDMLNYARPDALKPDWINIDEVLSKTINMLQGVIQQHQAVVKVNIQTGLPTLYADAGKLRQVFSNLISNAIHVASEAKINPQIMLSVMSRLGDRLPAIQIEVIDNGPGINNDLVEQLFEPFYTTRSKGSGLGLAIVRRFVEQHQGQVNLYSGEERGAICTVILPISELVTRMMEEDK
ncbi:MAG: PAS domain S-box protein [Cocleimonas sp.]|nr:PAS domain S-box protein [Cocleimonas sp.]